MQSAAQAHTFAADGLVSLRFGGATLFYTFDPLGGVAQRLDSGGNVGTSDLYDGFGATVAGGGGGDVFGFGGQWGEYPPCQTCHRRFRRWVKDDTLKNIVHAFARQADLDLSECFIDGA